MFKQVLMGLSALVLVGAGYTTVMAAEESCGCGGNEKVVLAEAASTAPAEKVDMKNTKCIVMTDDDADATKSVEYKGKLYHVCCNKCVKAFNKDPEKYVKAFEKDPASYGVKK
jgi:YHS domain-containing protein